MEFLFHVSEGMRIFPDKVSQLEVLLSSTTRLSLEVLSVLPLNLLENLPKNWCCPRKRISTSHCGRKGRLTPVLHCVDVFSSYLFDLMGNWYGDEGTASNAVLLTALVMFIQTLIGEVPFFFLSGWFDVSPKGRSSTVLPARDASGGNSTSFHFLFQAV